MIRSMNASQPTTPTERLVYLVTRDPAFAGYVSQQITHFGYHIQHVRDVKSLANGMVNHPAVAIIIDIPSAPFDAPESTFFTEICDLQMSERSIIFTSERDDQDLRLKAIQAGGVAFFTKPINIVSLVDRLDLLNRTITNPQTFRVLIVEEQSMVASYYNMVLKMAGMEAQIATSAKHILDQVRDFHPDLILMDTFMTEVNTADLARVIRQIEDFVSIPIIFLSSEDDFGKRIEALNLGGDDFLIKPIKAAHLIAVVRSRLERSKILRSYMVRDSLTNLLNHTAFRNILSQEESRCRRHNARMALAMLDIDHFKMVNDTYGHAVGDSVLKGLARLLQQRLRKHDVIGRYGGDELVAILIDCDGAQAYSIMEEIRRHFSEVAFEPGGSDPLYLTFSCGVSSFPQAQTAETLSDLADQALYRAKANGRNRTVVI